MSKVISTEVIEIRENYSHVYGLGERFDTIDLREKTVTNQVIEKFCNQGGQTYCSIPFFFTDSGLGVYADTKEKTVMTFEENVIRIEAPTGTQLKYYHGTPAQIVAEFIASIGTVRVPPLYAFGPWISANHWKSERDVEKIEAQLEEYDFPASVLVLEAWSDEATFYIFNGAAYTPKPNGEACGKDEYDYAQSKYWKDPERMIRRLKDKGIHTVLWQIPVYKKMEEENSGREQNMLDAEDAINRHLCVFNADGTPYRIPEGNWFAGSLIPDFTNPETVKTWFAHRQYLLDMGVDGFKTDGGEFIYSDDVRFANGETGREGKNAYCQEYVNAYYKFIGKDRLLFSRAGSTGAQITPILWAGDHQSTNDELKNVYRAAISSACSGISFWSFDIGGFAGPLPSPDLYRRATQFACFCPIMQWHSEPDGGQFKDIMPGAEGNNERSPWNIAYANAAHVNAALPKDECTSNIGKANGSDVVDPNEFIDEMRYWHKLRAKMAPYIYEQALACSRVNKPLMRPMFFEVSEEEAYLHEDEYFFGEELLVAPLLEENQTYRDVWLPKMGDRIWTGFFSGKTYPAGEVVSSIEEKFPVFVLVTASDTPRVSHRSLF